MVLRGSRAPNSGWLPTNPPEVNQNFNCIADLGSVSVHRREEKAEFFELLTTGRSLTLKVEPVVMRSDENIRKIPPKM